MIMLNSIIKYFLRLIFNDFISVEGWDSSKCPGYDIKQSDGEAPAMLELQEMWSISSLPLLPVSLWLGVVAPDRVQSMGQIELFDI